MLSEEGGAEQAFDHQPRAPPVRLSQAWFKFQKNKGTDNTRLN